MTNTLTIEIYELVITFYDLIGNVNSREVIRIEAHILSAVIDGITAFKDTTHDISFRKLSIPADHSRDIYRTTQDALNYLVNC